MLCIDANEELIEELLALIGDPAERISTMRMVAETFPPVTMRKPDME